MLAFTVAAGRITAIDIIDAATGPSPDQEEATEFFETSARNLHQAAAERGVAEILVVSIIGCEHFSTGFYGAKVAHERAHVEGPVPVRILRAGQFHEYVAEMVKWGIQGDTAYVAEMRTPAGRRRDGRRGARRPCRRSRRRAPRQPRVGSRRPPRGEPRRRGEAAGRQARRRAGDPGRRGPGRPWAAGALLPGPIAKLAGPTFEEWLNA